MTETTTQTDDTTSDDTEVPFRDKIIHVLSIYPTISPTMLQMGLGPGISPKIWRPHLQALIDEGVVVQDSVAKQSPMGRYHQYQRLQLSPEVLAQEQDKIS